ncbi:D-galacturonate reductase-like [Andrographis paniculata]|uniref:D-galacturonate reductase-like n=1 Tax=Andrographis paniculata TaxID=175694 RepID=UPI0021E98CAA|nr:D-galacturonate reductase-like [Andrographis paniculata]
MAINVPWVTLRGCDKPMPVIGLGTSSYPPADHATTKAAILEAIKLGYRHFDTAFAYGSERAVGAAIAEALRLGLVASRHELFVTTKLWATFADPGQIVAACKMSLQNLGLEYVDMYLIHLPVRLTEQIRAVPVAAEVVKSLDVEGAWGAMEECKKLGLTRGIGVSNFSSKMIEHLVAIATIPPALNQVEMNTGWQQKQLRDTCEAKGVHVTAYSPLGANNTKWGDARILRSQLLAAIAQAKGRTPAQVGLRWIYEQKVSMVVKSFNGERMKENLGIFDWCLDGGDLEKIRLQIPQRKAVTLASIFGPHPLILELDRELTN